jgi:hypothetical protein
MALMDRWRLGLAAVVALLVVGVACSGSDEPDLGPPSNVTRLGDADRTDPDTTRAGQTFHVAQAVDAELVVRKAPQDSADELTTLRAADDVSGMIVCLVAQELGDDWLEVYLPTGGSADTGWVQRDDVTLSRHRFRIEIALSEHTMTVYTGTTVALSAPVALGPDAPDAGARLFVKDLVQPPDPAGPYRTYAYGLSGSTDDLDAFLAGRGVVAVHGTDDPAELGGDAPRGAIGVDGAVVTQMVEGIGLPLGTPVDVVS